MNKDDAAKIKILLVDDSPDITDLLVDQLQSLGFDDVDKTNNGQDAYNFCVKKFSEGSCYNLIISDFKMPRMTGLELLRKVRNNSLLEETKFILITGFGEEHIVKESISLKLDDFITKPFNQETLSRKLDQIFSKPKKRR